jgi:hypothetical protein
MDINYSNISPITGMKLLKVLQDSLIASYHLIYSNENNSYVEFAESFSKMEEESQKSILTTGLIINIDKLQLDFINTFLDSKLDIGVFTKYKIQINLLVYLYHSKLFGNIKYNEFIDTFNNLDKNIKRELLKIAFIGCFDEVLYKENFNFFKELNTGLKINDFNIKDNKQFLNDENIEILFDKMFEFHKNFEYINSFFVDLSEVKELSLNLYKNFDNIETYKNFQDYIDSCLLKGE